MPRAHPGAYLPDIAIPACWASLLRVHALADGITIGCWEGRPERDWMVRAEGAAGFCIGILLDGGGSHMAFDGGATLDLKPGMAVLQSTAGTTTGWNEMKGGVTTRLVDLRFSPQLLQRIAGDVNPRLRGALLQDCSLPRADAYMGGLCASTALLRTASDILHCDFPDGAARTLYLHAKAMEALAIVLQGLASAGEARPLPVPADRRRLLAARQLLEQRCGEAWTVAAVAQAVGLNEKRLQSGFLALYGQSVHAQLTQIRTEAAAAMLSRGASVTEVALTVGFSSLSHFSKVFRAQMGTAPKAWALHHAGAGTARWSAEVRAEA